MAISKEEVLRDIKRMRSYMVKHNSFSELTRNMNDYNFLNNLLYEIDGTKASYEGFIFNPESHMQKLTTKNKKISTNLYNNIRKDYELFLPTFISFNNMLDKNNYIMIPFVNNQRSFTWEEAKEIILDFFKEFDDTTYKIVCKALNETIEFNEAFFNNSNSEGHCQHITLLNKSYILLKGKLDSMYLKFLVHELGHVVEKTKYIVSQSKNLFHDNSIMLEAPALFYEYKFSEYLKRNRISYKDTVVNDNMEIFGIKVRSINYITICDSSIYYILNNDDIVVLQENGSFYKYNPLDIICYGMGGIVALHLCELYDKDSDKFNKLFTDFMCSRKETTTTEKIENLGIPFEQFTSCEMIEGRVLRMIKESKDRFNINV